MWIFCRCSDVITIFPPVRPAISIEKIEPRLWSNATEGVCVKEPERKSEGGEERWRAGGEGGQ